MMGSTSDPADGKAVAGSVFAAVVVYAVCYTLSGLWNWDLGFFGRRYFGSVDNYKDADGFRLMI